MSTNNADHLVNPLDCSICKNEMVEPVRLSCQHNFCKQCIESKQICPVCETPFCSSKIVVDRVLSYVICSSHESTEKCANCDEISQPMSFCETCRQPLCQNCVMITHSAKFFASHQIKPLEERGRLRGHLSCTEHNGPYVLYCQEARKLMCIECFNGSSLERRNNFVNIDEGHRICREKLDKSVIRLRSFQNELKEQTEVRIRLLAETEAKFVSAEEQVLEKYNQIVEALTKRKVELLEEINTTKQTQTLQIQQKINALTNMEGPIRLNLLSASVFCSYASNLDLLHCYSDLSKNINTVMSHKLEKISFKDSATTNYVENLVSVLHELDLKSDSNKENLEENSSNVFPFVSLDLWKRMDHKLKQDSDASRSLSPLSFNYANQNGLHFNSILLETGPNFEETFQKIDAPIRQFLEETNSISKELLDVQRDITLRRCLIDKQAMDRLVERCESLSSRLNAHSALIHHQIKPQLTDIWNEQLEVLYKQQSMVQTRLTDLTKIQSFTQQALDIGQKLRPLSNFLSSVISAVDSRRSGINPVPPMEQICMEILNILPDSKQRIEAIEKEEEQRRLVRENEKFIAEKEARALKKNLKETRKTRQRPVSTIVVEQNRDRNDSIPMELTQKLQKRLKRTSQSDDANSSICSMSPRTLSSTVSLDATSLNAIELPSPNSLSPLPNKRSESALEISNPLSPPPILTPPPPTSPLPPLTSESPTIKNPISKPMVPIPGMTSNAPSADIVMARSLLMQSIKEKVKRID